MGDDGEWFTYLPNLCLNICRIIVLGVRSDKVNGVIIETFGSSDTGGIFFGLLSILYTGGINLWPLLVRHLGYDKD